MMKSYRQDNVIYLRDYENCGMSIQIKELNALFAAVTGKTVGQRHLRGILLCALTDDILLANFISKKFENITMNQT